MTDPIPDAGWDPAVARLPPPSRPTWHPSMSDGCTSRLGKAMEALYPQALACCLDHDQAYYDGGDELARRIADVAFWL